MVVQGVLIATSEIHRWPQGGKQAAKPSEGAARQAIFAKSIAWLADQQQSSGGFSETLGGGSAACRKPLAS